jgi:hypothetical protein
MARRHDSLIPLSRDHRDALALAFRLHHPSPPGPATAVTPPSTPASRAAEVLDFFAAHLDGHFRAEEKELFPCIAAGVRAAADESTSELLGELVAEHRRMELRDAIAAALARAVDEPPGDDALDQPLREFATVLERHVRREERDLFVRFDRVVPAADAVAVGPRIQAILDTRPARACSVVPDREE